MTQVGQLFAQLCMSVIYLMETQNDDDAKDMFKNVVVSRGPSTYWHGDGYHYVIRVLIK